LEVGLCVVVGLVIDPGGMLIELDIQGFEIRQLSIRDFFESEFDEGRDSNLLPAFGSVNLNGLEDPDEG
jgi:hypothetical protein